MKTLKNKSAVSKPKTSGVWRKALLILLILFAGGLSWRGAYVGEPQGDNISSSTRADSMKSAPYPEKVLGDALPTSSSIRSEGGKRDSVEQKTLWQVFQSVRHQIQSPDSAELDLPGNKGVRFFAANPSQQIVARFSDYGAELSSGLQGKWGVNVRATYYRRGEDRQSLDGAIKPTASGSRVEYDRGELIEWFDNRPSGIEHGFTVLHKPFEQGSSELEVGISLAGLKTKSYQGCVQLVSEMGGNVMAYDKLLVWDANGKKLPASMKASAQGASILVADAGAVYPITIDPLFTSFEAKLGIGELECGRPGDSLGHSVDVLGDRAVVGAPGDDSLLGTDAGAAYLFERSGTTWTLAAKLKAKDGKAGDRLGGAVALGDGYALAGARLADLPGKEDAGAVYSFGIVTGMWAQTAKLIARVSMAGAWFGESLSTDGAQLLIGAPNGNGGKGGAYIFARAGASWAQKAVLTASDGINGDGFGGSVAIRGGTAIVCAPQRDSTKGGAYVFSGSGTTWIQEQTMTLADGAVGDFFGDASSLGSDAVIIGAPGRTTTLAPGTGAAFVFRKPATSWTQTQQILSSDAAEGDRFGTAISQYGKVVIVGAPGVDVTNPNEGSAYLFSDMSGTFEQEAKLTAPGGRSGDWFGASVAVDMTTAVVGAFQADPDDFDGTPSIDQGCVYVFRLFSTTNGSDVAVKSPSGAGTEETAVELVDESSLDFGSVIILTSVQRQLVIRNLGASPLTNLKALVSGTNANQFKISMPPPGTLAPGESFALIISFNPSGVGGRQASVRISSNDVDEGALDVALTGIGVEATEVMVTNPQSQIVALGSTAGFAVSASGIPAPTLQWRKAGRNIKGATRASYRLKATLTDAGSYDVVASNVGGSDTSDSASLAVVDTTLRDLCLPVGARATMTVVAAGAGLSFTWRKEGGSLGTSPKVTVSADGRTLTINDLIESDMGSYSCLVSSPGGELAGGRYNLTVFSAAPEFSEFSLPPARVTCPYSFQVPYDVSPALKPTRFTATGLPAGMSIDAVTGVISGVPTGTGNSQREVTITASNSFGNTPVTKTLYIYGLPCGVVGEFKGLIQRDGGLNGGFGGYFDLEIAPTGLFTGSLTLGADKHPFSGALKYCDDLYSKMATTVIVARKNLSAVTVVFEIDSYNNTLTGHVTDRSNAPWTFMNFVGQPNVAGSSDGKGTDATFNCPTGMARDKLGNLYVADTDNHVIRRVSSVGDVVVFAGVAGVPGSGDGCGPSVGFNSPRGIAVDARGFLFVADTGNHTIRQITSEGKVTTIAGSATTAGTTDGPSDVARFQSPAGVALGMDGSLFITDMTAHKIRRLTGGSVSTVAGKAGVAGAKNGTGTAAEFHSPMGVAILQNESLLVADSGNHCIRQISISRRTVATFAGTLGVGGDADGEKADSRFLHPSDLTADTRGNVFVTDTGNGTVRRINTFGVVTTITDPCPATLDDMEDPRTAQPGYYDCCVPTLSESPFREPVGIVFAAGKLYVSDCYYHTIQTGSPEKSCEIAINAVRKPWGRDSISTVSRKNTTSSCSFPPATLYAGTYKFILDPCESARSEPLVYPQGTGFGTLTVLSNGTVNCVGTLSDGTTVTGSSILGGSSYQMYYDAYNKIPLFFMLYGNTGSVQGWHQISVYSMNNSAPQTPTQSSKYVGGCMDWWKNSQISPSGAYPDGFPLHGLQVVGEEKSSSNEIVVGSYFPQSSNNARFELLGHGLAAGFIQIFTLNANNSTSMPSGSGNPNDLSFSFSGSTFQFNGSYRAGQSSPTSNFKGVFLKIYGRGYGFSMLDNRSHQVQFTSQSSQPD
jgi:sugar lactone lactonase YvrE